MNELQQLRGQLEELGFTPLEDSRIHKANVLNVEVWVRYTPYALVTLPIRGVQEDETSYSARLVIANDSIADLFAQDASGYEGGFPSIGYDAPAEAEPYADDYASSEEPDGEYEIPPVEDYYAYIPPATPAVSVDPQPEPLYIQNPPEPIENEPAPVDVEYAEARQARLLRTRASLISALEEVDALLSE